MIKTVIIGVSVLLVLQHVLSLIYDMGFHKWAYNHRPGPCRVVPGIETGSEDIHVLTSGLALITSGIDLGKMGFMMDPSALKWKGHIYAFDLNNPSGNVSEVPILGPFDQSDFRPHGMGVWQDLSQTRVFVVNHKKTHEAIEVFQFDEEKRTLTFLHSITGPSLRRKTSDKPGQNWLNDIQGRTYLIWIDGKNSQQLEIKPSKCLEIRWKNKLMMFLFV